MNSPNAGQILGYQFKDPSLLEESLRHASVAQSRKASNERMEFLGDSILSFIVCEQLFRQFPDMLEGDLTKIKSAVVSRKICATISRELGLIELIYLGKGMSRGAQLPESVCAAVYESIIAAIYLDGGLEPTRDFIQRTLFKFIKDVNRPGSHQENYKSTLQTVAQRMSSSNPQYTLLDEDGPDHAKQFQVCVIISGRRFSSAWASTKKQAEQAAALNTLTELGYATRDDLGQVVLNDQPVIQASASPDPADALSHAGPHSTQDAQPASTSDLTPPTDNNAV